MQNKSLVIGVGNTLRGDDGVGDYVCQQIQSMNLSGVDTIIVQQLDTLLLPMLSTYKHIIIVDAAIKSEWVEIRLLSMDEQPTAIPLAHHVSVQSLAMLSQKLYACEAIFYTCAIPAKNFEYEDQISEQAEMHAQQAIQMIKDLIATF